MSCVVVKCTSNVTQLIISSQQKFFSDLMNNTAGCLVRYYENYKWVPEVLGGLMYTKCNVQPSRLRLKLSATCNRVGCYYRAK